MSLAEQKSSRGSTQTMSDPESETERLRRDIFRSDMEKFQLFTQMLRTNAMFKRAKITHKK
jgi:hypothetical protein